MTHTLLVRVYRVVLTVSSSQGGRKGAEISLITRKQAPLMLVFQPKHLSVTKFIMGSERSPETPFSRDVSTDSSPLGREWTHFHLFVAHYWHSSVVLGLVGPIFFAIYYIHKPSFPEYPKHRKYLFLKMIFCSEAEFTLGHQNNPLTSVICK